MTLPTKTPPPADIMEAVITKGDLSKLTSEESVEYYNAVCKSIGLNPLTRPLEYIVLSGKRVLYARRDCADQLRKINGISITIVSQEQNDGLLTIHVRAKDRLGREDEDLGVVPFPDTLKGELRSNQILKCVTKAKRRVTLSISGLGFLDETEVDNIPGARRPKPPGPNVMTPLDTNEYNADPETGELVEPSPGEAPGVTAVAPPSPPHSAQATDADGGGGATLSVEDMAREAASKGAEELEKYWKSCSPEDREKFRKIQDELIALRENAEAGRPAKQERVK